MFRSGDLIRVTSLCESDEETSLKVGMFATISMAYIWGDKGKYSIHVCKFESPIFNLADNSKKSDFYALYEGCIELVNKERGVENEVK